MRHLPTLPGDSRPCLCRGGENLTAEQAVAHEPHWSAVNPYCPTHGNRTAGEHDLDLFPQALNSYSCQSCQHGDHLHCQPTIVYPDWRHDCSCHRAAAAAHVAVQRAAKRDELARVVYAAADGQTQFWLPTVDGTPNQASYAIADALLDGHHAR